MLQKSNSKERSIPESALCASHGPLWKETIEGRSFAEAVAKEKKTASAPVTAIYEKNRQFSEGGETAIDGSLLVKQNIDNWGAFAIPYPRTNASEGASLAGKTKIV